MTFPDRRVNVLITCGPSSEAIDAVRRVTNHSTGALGAALARAFAALGHNVLCLRGSGATSPPPEPPVEVVPFFGNRDLETLLQKEAGRHDLVLHLAALADFFPVRIDCDGTSLPAGPSGKIRSDANLLTVHFERATKLIALLRPLFPKAVLVGWKYEVDAGDAEILLRGSAQIAAHQLDACVLNGPSLGERLVLLDANDAVITSRNREEFVDFFVPHCAVIRG